MVSLLKIWQTAVEFYCLGIFVGAIYTSMAWPVLMAWRFGCYGLFDQCGLILLGVYLIALLVPLQWVSFGWIDAFVRFSSLVAARYFPITVKVEDEEALKAGTSYVIGFEPHSSLPTAIPAVFATHSALLPKALRGACHIMASSICFYIPFVREVWYWIGVRPVTREAIHKYLNTGKSVVLLPGGVQECLFMEKNCEVVFLRNRLGFIRLAIQNGAPLVPVFALNQTATYNWYRLGPPLFPAALVSLISRSIGFAPIFMLGTYNTPMPLRKHITVVIGKPIQVPKIDYPTQAQVQEYLDKFISELQRLFETYKHDAGVDCPLKVL